MKPRRANFLVAALLSIAAQSQTLRSSSPAFQSAFGAYGPKHADAFSFIANAASLAQINNAAAGLCCERRFLLSELTQFTATIVTPTRSGNFGLKAAYFGTSSFNETQIGLSYALKLGPNVDLGAQFNYNRTKVAAYGSLSALSIEVGTGFHINDKLNAGFNVSNPIGVISGNPSNEKFPLIYCAGFGYDASEKVFAYVEIIKEEDQPATLNAGLQYKPVSQLLIRSGISTASSSLWFGVGVYLNNFRLDLYTCYHPQLGTTPGLSLLFDKTKDK